MKRQRQVAIKTPKLQAMSDSSHNMDFENVKVVGFEANYQERLFLEAWRSILDQNAGKDHITNQEAYKGIARA